MESHVPQDASQHELRRCVYAGTFDPPTNGHLWMIDRGAMLFDQLEVAVGVNPDKRTRFTVEERMQMLTAITEPYPNVQVNYFENSYLANYAKVNGFKFMLRGLRSAKDFDYEHEMNSVNRTIRPDIQAVYLLCPDELAATSSSLVKGLVGPEGWEVVVAKYVPEFVLEALKNHHAVSS